MATTLEEQLRASIEMVERRKERTTKMSEKIQLSTNVWEEVALRWPDGKNLMNEYGESVMFSTVDGRVLFMPVPAAEKVRALQLAPGAKMRIRKAEVKNGGPKPHIEWQVQRVGEQPDGTFAIQKEAATALPAAAPATGTTQSPNNTSTNNGSSVNGNGTANGQRKDSPLEHSGHAALLRETTNMLVDVLAACKNYSAKYNGLLSADDVRSCMLSAYINLSKGPKQ